MKRFKKVYIEITNRCNLSCNFCPKLGRQLGRVDESHFAHILSEVKPYTDYLYFHLMGEPLLHPELETFLKMSKAEGFKVNLTTNGTLLQKNKEILLNAKVIRQINISLHSYEANTNHIKFEQYVDEVIAFVQAAAEASIICSIRLWNMETESLKADNSLNHKILKMLEEKLNLDFDLGEQMQIKSGIKLGERMYLNSAEKFEWPTLEREVISEQAFCYGLRDQMGILVDGTVVPCCLDSEGNIPLGNIYQQSLQEILASERAQALYDGFTNRCAKEALCQRCGYVQRYTK